MKVLRTTFAMSEGRAVQVAATALTVQIPVVDLRAVSETLRSGGGSPSDARGGAAAVRSRTGTVDSRAAAPRRRIDPTCSF